MVAEGPTISEPVPLRVPPVQLKDPDTVTVLVPDSVPDPERVRLGMLMLEAVLKFTVPEPVTVVEALYDPCTVTVPLLKFTVIPPLTLDCVSRVWVPPKLRVAPADPVKLPLLLPPAARLRVPVRTSTVPPLLKGMLMALVPAPALFLTVPELVKAGAPLFNQIVLSV